MNDPPRLDTAARPLITGAECLPGSSAVIRGGTSTGKDDLEYMQIIWQLFSSFFVIGALTFGGGYSMLPMLTREIVQKRGWATEEELLNYFAIGQCTPGVIAVNTATFIGYKRRGVLGGIVATLGVVAPSVLIITVIAALLQNFMEIQVIQHAFAGIRVAVTALILATVVKLFRQTVKNLLHILLCVAAFVAVALFNLSPVWVVLAVIALGVVLTLVKGKRDPQGGDSK